MPQRWCQCTGCPACRVANGTHGVLFDLDATRTTRCPACQQHATARRNARPSSSIRGLGWAFSARKASDRNYQEATRCQCAGQCRRHHGPCGEPFTPTNPKTGGHLTPRSRGGGGGPIIAMCRQCNSAEGGRLASRA